MNIPTVGVIMAGGSGERFWPLSRQTMPKQLLRISDEQKSLLEEAVNRLLPLLPPERIVIATNNLLQDPIRFAKIPVPPENVLAEPVRRNTCGCLAFAAAHLLARFGKSSDDLLMAVTTADHSIRDDEAFRRTVKSALAFAQENDALMVIGIQPTRPETGYGYIETAEDRQPEAVHEGVPVYKALHFHEKPSLEKAEAYIAQKRFYWNSGMFFWRMSTYLNSMEKADPRITRSIHEMRDTLLTGYNPDSIIASIFERLPNISIDYALMEKADNVYVVQGGFQWDDLGAWDSLARFRSQDERGNITHGDPILIDCQNVTVYNEPGAERMAVGVIGMEGVVVVTSPDGILICPKDRCQDVRRIVDELKKRGAGQV